MDAEDTLNIKIAGQPTETLQDLVIKLWDDPRDEAYEVFCRVLVELEVRMPEADFSKFCDELYDGVLTARMRELP